MKDVSEITGIGDEAVRAKTGKTWSQWFALLDRAGAAKMPHKEIATHLYERHGCPGWWAQMVTVGYERARGLRAKHETATGYAVSVSKTIGAPLGGLYRAWAVERTRRRWLPETGITIRKATPNKSMRITWIDGKTSLDVYFYGKGARRSQINVQHRKLSDAKQVAPMKAHWGERLERLKGMLEA